MVLTFLGIKGGAGTTTMSVNCAAAIRRLSGRSTVLIDAKIGPGDVAAFLGLRARHSLLDVLDQSRWNDPSRGARFLVEHECGVRVLPAGEDFSRPSADDLEALEQTIAGLAATHDVVVIDAGCMVTPATVSAVTTADVVILVANPDVPCLRHITRLSDALRVAGMLPERMRILLNRTSEQGVMPVPQIERVLNRPIDFQVTSDYRTVALSLNSGVPIAALRATEVKRQIDNVARALIGHDRAPAA